MDIRDQLDILRRISDRGLSLAYKLDTRFVDLFQHLLDEIHRAERGLPKEWLVTQQSNTTAEDS